MNFNTIFILIFISIVWMSWSFKIHKTLFDSTRGTKKNDGGKCDHYKGYDLIAHTGSDILGAGVCVLGKIGFWIMALWSVFVILFLKFFNKDSATYKKNMKTIYTMNIVITVTIFILALFMNPPLWARSIPFFILQAVVCYYLIVGENGSKN
jgi:hypothetical protein